MRAGDPQRDTLLAFGVGPSDPRRGEAAAWTALADDCDAGWSIGVGLRGAGAGSGLLLDVEGVVVRRVRAHVRQPVRAAALDARVPLSRRRDHADLLRAGEIQVGIVSEKGCGQPSHDPQTTWQVTKPYQGVTRWGRRSCWVPWSWGSPSWPRPVRAVPNPE